MQLKTKDITVYKNLFAKKHFQKAKSLMKKNIDEGCLTAQTLFYLADCEYELGNYEKAMQGYTEVINFKKKTSFEPNAYFNRALCKAELKQYSEAIIDFTKAQEMGENAEFFLAEMFTTLKNFHKAYAHIKKWNLSKPNDGKGWVYTGIIQNALDKHMEALSSFHKAFELGQKDEYVIDGIITESNFLDEIIEMITFVLQNKSLLNKKLLTKTMDIIEDYTTNGGKIPIHLQEKMNDLETEEEKEQVPVQASN